tara:strand:+ start:430 stop:825 length:396 start_codon:yes stop_codon:yes gene_type:complete
MSLELIDEKTNNQIKEKLRCYLKVVFPKNTETKNKEIMKFYNDNQEAIFKKTKILLEECSTPANKNIKSSGGRKKTKSKRNHKTKTRKTRRKKGGSLMTAAHAVAAVTIGMFFAFFFTLALVPTEDDERDE